jgi:hypothetical protein
MVRILWDEREERRHRKEAYSDQRKHAVRIFVAFAAIVSLLGGLRALGALDAIRRLLAP